MERVVWSKWLMENEGTAEEESLGELDGSYISTGLNQGCAQGGGGGKAPVGTVRVYWLAGWPAGWLVSETLHGKQYLSTYSS
jgi:hypothetical protein